MKMQWIFRFGFTFVALVTVFTLVGCGMIPSTVTVNEPTQASTPVPSVPPTEVSVENTPVAIPVSGANVLFQDDFTNPATGWPEDKFDNYFIGYHEPEYYHIEISSANYKTTVFEPQKTRFVAATLELQVFAVSSKS